MKTPYFLIIALCIGTGWAYAQQTGLDRDTDSTATNFFTTNMDYQVRAHFSIGGSSPLGLPREIRAIDQYNPKLQLGLSANATKWLDDKWGARLGIKVEGKGMGTKADVKNYLTEIIREDSKVRGYYTGSVKTVVKNTYATVPVLAVYKLTSNWNLYGGLYFSILIDKEFDGYVSDGYLRQGKPTGAKISFENGSRAPFDFSQEERKFQWGAEFGAEWSLNRHFILFPEITYGINGLLHDDFEAISFSMHNIYLNLGFGYTF